MANTDVGNINYILITRMESVGKPFHV